MTHLLIAIYTAVTACLLLPALPFLLVLLPFREVKRRSGLGSFKEKNYIWFHCASVGEVNALKPLLTAFKKRFPAEKVLLTTMTMTGQKRANSLKECDLVTFIPVDFLPFIAFFIRKIQPKMIIIIETELWPSLLYAAKVKKIPVSIINGRISDRTYKRYKLLSFLLKGLYRSVTIVGSQSPSDKQRFLSLGFPAVRHTRNLKFSLRLPEYEPSAIRKEWKLDPDDFVLVWGSSRPGEEQLLISILPGLQKEIPNLKVIIAPRHLKRTAQIVTLLNSFSYTLLSELAQEYDILLIDAMNILTRAYAISDIAVVGGSFYDYGGHNPLEPAFYAKPVIIGNYHASCRQSVKKLEDNNAILISNSDSLSSDILKLYSSKEQRTILGLNAKKTIDENSRSVEENLQLIKSILKKLQLSS